MLKQSVCSPIIKPAEIQYQQFIPEIARIGYQAIEFWNIPDEIDEIADLCAAHNIAISSFTGHNDILHGMNDLTQHARIYDELSRSIEIAEKYHIHGIICFWGGILPDQTIQTSKENCMTFLDRIKATAENAGILLNVELLNSIIDHPGYEMDRSWIGLDLVKELNHPNVKLLYDIYHMQIMEGNVIDTITNNINWIGHFHTAGVPGRFDLDDDQELNYRAISKQIARSGYAHYFGHEFSPKGHYLDALRHAFMICSQT